MFVYFYILNWLDKKGYSAIDYPFYFKDTQYGKNDNYSSYYTQRLTEK